MCSARNRERHRRIARPLPEARAAFTLLEVMLAVMIMALIAISIYRFVELDIQAIKVSTDDTMQKGAIQALVSVLQEEFCNLPPQEPGALLGDAHQFGGKASDEIRWLTQAGNGLFTQAASGPWRVTMLLRPQDKSNSNMLGFLRQLPDSNSKEENWLPLLPNVDAVEIRYFDSRLNSWLQKWSDAQTHPTLIRIRIWRANQTVPYETVIELPPTRLPT